MRSVTSSSTIVHSLVSRIVLISVSATTTPTSFTSTSSSSSTTASSSSATSIVVFANHVLRIMRSSIWIIRCSIGSSHWRRRRHSIHLIWISTRNNRYLLTNHLWWVRHMRNSGSSLMHWHSSCVMVRRSIRWVRNGNTWMLRWGLWLLLLLWLMRSLIRRLACLLLFISTRWCNCTFMRLLGLLMHVRMLLQMLRWLTRLLLHSRVTSGVLHRKMWIHNRHHSRLSHRMLHVVWLPRNLLRDRCTSVWIDHLLWVCRRRRCRGSKGRRECLCSRIERKRFSIRVQLDGSLLLFFLCLGVLSLSFCSTVSVLSFFILDDTLLLGRFGIFDFRGLLLFLFANFLGRLFECLF
mmetsp:Transcript_12335/g.20430  ORF Transcript_12335/g.20430 Transcript_12335/m.20430 type:complete len:351 (-) Transcript_12335:1280-2332(-)